MAAAAPVSIKVPTGHISGHVPSSALDAVVAEGGFKSWLCLLPSYTEEQCPEAAIRGKGIEFAQIPLEVSRRSLIVTIPGRHFVILIRRAPIASRLLRRFLPI